MYKTKRKYQGEPIRTDPTCDPKENETAIHFNGGDRLAWVSSYEEAVVSGLLAHPDFKISELILMRIERKDSVVGVVGKIPIAALRIGNSRDSNEHALVIPRILKDKLFSPVLEEAPPKPVQKTLARPEKNGKSSKIQKKLEKAKLPLLTAKTREKEKELVLSKSSNGKKSVKRSEATVSKATKKKGATNQLPLIPLPMSSKKNSKKPAKAKAISSRKAKALKPSKSQKKSKPKPKAQSRSKATSKAKMRKASRRR